MSKLVKRVIAFSASGFYLALFPLLSFAATINNPVRLTNPLGSTNTLAGFITKLLNEVVVPIGSVVLVLALIYCGFLFVVAQGNDSKLKEAKTAFFYTMIGGAVLLGASVLSSVVENTINSLRGPATPP
jgi:hypothetical protein